MVSEKCGYWQQAALPISPYIGFKITTRGMPQSQTGYLMTLQPLGAL